MSWKEQETIDIRDILSISSIQNPLLNVDNKISKAVTSIVV